MKEIKYLSPSSLKLFFSDIDQFYRQYLSDKQFDRMPQTKPMAIGSAFDARVKAYLYKELVNGGDSRFDLVALFESQVEIQNRNEVWRDSDDLFNWYKKNGMADLIRMMQGSLMEPRFEFGITSHVKTSIGGVELNGRPDCYFINKAGFPVILDWKVNGFYSNSKKSPAKGYVFSYPDMKSHRDTIVREYQGIGISNFKIEETDKDWANQLSIYGWLLGNEVGKEIIVAVDQLVGMRGEPRMAQFRGKVSQQYQEEWFKTIHKVWDHLKRGHIYMDMTLEQSQTRCKLFDDPGEKLFQIDGPQLKEMLG